MSCRRLALTIGVLFGRTVVIIPYVMPTVASVPIFQKSTLQYLAPIEKQKSGRKLLLPKMQEVQAYFVNWWYFTRAIIYRIVT